MNDDDSITFYQDQIQKIMEFINTNKIIPALNESEILLNVIPDEQKKKYSSIKKEINAILSDHAFIRKVKILDTIKNDPESNIEYHSKPRGCDDNLIYDKLTEDKIIIITKKIKTILSDIIKNEILGDIKL